MIVPSDDRPRPVLSRNIPASRRSAARDAWLSLEGRARAVPLACSWAWTETWLRHYGDVVPHRFVVGVVDGDDRGIALVTESVGRRPARVGPRQAHVGTIGEPQGESVYVERNGLLVVAEGDRAPFAAAVLANVRNDPRWDRLAIAGLNVADAEAFKAADPAFVLVAEESPVAELALATGGDPLELLSSTTRRRARRALKGLGPLETEWADTPAHAHDIMDELIEIHQRRWTTAGEPGAFAGPRFTRFHRALIDRLGPGQGVVLARVRRADETLGCIYGLVEGRDVLFYQSGLRRHPDNKLNVGFVVHACVMGACLEHDFDAYDFLAPATRYKHDLSTRANTAVWATLERDRPRMYAARALRGLRGYRRRAESATARVVTLVPTVKPG